MTPSDLGRFHEEPSDQAIETAEGISIWPVWLRFSPVNMMIHLPAVSSVTLIVADFQVPHPPLVQLTEKLAGSLAALTLLH